MNKELTPPEERNRFIPPVCKICHTAESGVHIRAGYHGEYVCQSCIEELIEAMCKYGTDSTKPDVCFCLEEKMRDKANFKMYGKAH